MTDQPGKKANKIADTIAELLAHVGEAIAEVRDPSKPTSATEQADGFEALEEYFAREAKVRDRGHTRIDGQISGRRDWDSACIGSVEFCTNGPQGGDAGYGGFVRITFRNRASTCMEVSVNDQAAQAADAVAITFEGDAKILACVESLEFLAAKLRAAAELW